MCITFALKTRYNRILKARFLLFSKNKKILRFSFSKKKKKKKLKFFKKILYKS